MIGVSVNSTRLYSPVSEKLGYVNKLHFGQDLGETI